MVDEQLAVRRALFSKVPVTSRFDFNRDGSVNALDLAAARSNLDRSLVLPVEQGPAGAPAGSSGAILMDETTLMK